MRTFLFLLTLAGTTLATAAENDLSYYFSEPHVNPEITTPQEFFGYVPGEYHIPYFQLIDYLKLLAERSNRLTIQKYGETYEKRPLYLITATSPQNHKNLQEIRQEHLKLANPAESFELKTDRMPIVVWLGYSVHGNEASGVNSVPLLLYHLAAAQGAQIENILDKMIILVDPCINPDGYNRFSTWVNMYRGAKPVGDPDHQEHREVWPGGRTNHYWFDLNRDWLLLQHPESQGRIKQFHKWLPNIVDDHHEMGTNETFFFQPGIPARMNPLIPQQNLELNRKIASFYAASLDSIGSLYYSEEQYDDFYFGKGSTYPDLQGAVGILFEQASSRGHLQENRFGSLSFRFAIRNQLTASLASLKAGLVLKNELLNYQREFFRESVNLAKKEKSQGFVFAEQYDKTRLLKFIELLQRHQIQLYFAKEDIKSEGRIFSQQNSVIVPAAQPQYRLIMALFEKQTSFRDSLFYDISSWTLPLAFNIDYAPITTTLSNVLGEALDKEFINLKSQLPQGPAYSYAFEWDDYNAPSLLYRIQSEGIKTSVATESFVAGELNNHRFNRGTIIIPTGIQQQPGRLPGLFQKLMENEGIKIWSLSTGYHQIGADIGSASVKTLEKPVVALITGPGISSTQAGEIWHQLDARYQMEVSLVDKMRVKRLTMERYNVLIMPSGQYGEWDSVTVANINKWISSGGTLIAFEGAARWLSDKKVASIKWIEKDKQKLKRRPYAERSRDLGAQRISGAIFQVRLDLTHPLAFGYRSEFLPVFKRGNRAMQISEDAYSTPGVYSSSPLLSGYAPGKSVAKIAGTASLLVSRKGAGRIIIFSNDVVFRAFWYGTTKLLANAVFFGQIIN